MIDETEITVCETLCHMSSSERATYSKDKLFGMILSLSSVLINSEYLACESYPQISLVIENKLKSRYNFSFLHSLAVYITMHQELIDWHEIFSLLSKTEVNTPLLILLKIVQSYLSSHPR